MEFQKLVKQLRELNLPEGEYVVVGSGALAARGMREANDLDILVTKHLWDSLASNYKVEITPEGIENINLGDIQILGKGSVFSDESIADLQTLIQTTEAVEGIRFISLPYLKKFKQKLGREKDLKDIKLIDNYLRDSSRSSE
ncbi:MAG: hypothetical protein A3A58_03230 [Candidatus Blackburnbacteria bacterium RIFCSPLOWO2_01_FULL_41_27]|uniref:Uncharacterized protein n=2 Tax=Candidatus Blackburniibacteriota TaxID=1817898 RepID=A0A1G1V6Y3_9BACT|nr:MAG: hypothetical protein A3F61_04405 [Candidatus Blackburnbacteria bacterium RIFCSPHIGHO2_12_FULL_41_13b]OGY13029.1 MAG: hypothetical protein A3A58_03230 [Candidatus Blackburnbacteria bacterium RIFCSPLOWO2_01_FULL_41_27]